MKTIQHNICIRFLALGAFSLLLLGASCKKTADYYQGATFILINKTDKAIKFNYPNKSINIGANESHSISTSSIGPRTIVPQQVYNSPLPMILTGEQRQELLTTIGDKCLLHTRKSSHSLIELDSYTTEKINEGEYKFTYTFTEEDYKRASDCQ